MRIKISFILIRIEKKNYILKGVQFFLNKQEISKRRYIYLSIYLYIRTSNYTFFGETTSSFAIPDPTSLGAVRKQKRTYQKVRKSRARSAPLTPIPQRSCDSRSTGTLHTRPSKGEKLIQGSIMGMAYIYAFILYYPADNTVVLRLVGELRISKKYFLSLLTIFFLCG